MVDGLAALGTVFGFAGFMAFAIERIIEWVVKPAALSVLAAFGWEEDEGKKALSSYIPLVSIVFGFVISLGFGIDLVSNIAQGVGLNPSPWIALVFSAVVMSGGSNLIHDLWPQSAPAE